MLLFARNDALLNEGDPLTPAWLAVVVVVVVAVLHWGEGETREELVAVEALCLGRKT